MGEKESRRREDNSRSTRRRSRSRSNEREYTRQRRRSNSRSGERNSRDRQNVNHDRYERARDEKEIERRGRNERTERDERRGRGEGERLPINNNVDNDIDDKGDQNEKEKEKEKVNFGLSGLLTKETNTFRGVVIKYNEPPDAIQPKNKYRWYVYKGDKEIDMLPLHRQSAYLIGRDRKVADIPLDHESISKQHAVLQYRKVKGVDPNTNKSQSMIKPYIIDLDSANGTFVNDIQIPATRYFELKSKDIIKFGGSTRDYVFIQDESE